VITRGTGAPDALGGTVANVLEIVSGEGDDCNGDNEQPKGDEVP
jgi:hypothetical protein